MTGTIHPDAVCSEASLGPRVRVDALALVAPDAVVEEDGHIGPQATIGPGAHLGPRVEVGAGARVGEGVRVEAGAHVGANAVLASGIGVGRGGVVEPGAYVIADVPATAIVRGNPAVIVGYAHTARGPSTVRDLDAGSVPRDVPGGCALWPLPRFQDLRGSLVAVEFERDLPFVPARSFLVFDVPSEEVRGEHAHRWCSQVLVAAHGALSVVVDDGRASAEVRLDRPDEGLLVPPGVWGIQYRFSGDAVLCVYASHPYDPDDYIRDYEDFLEFATPSQAETTVSG